MPKPPKSATRRWCCGGDEHARDVRVPVAESGNAGVVSSSSVVEPVDVYQTWPSSVPTMRTLSFCGEMLIELMTPLTESGFWLTSGVVRPLSVDR